MSKGQKKSFVFNIDWYEVLKDYPPEVRLEVYEAVIKYAASGTLSELKPLSNMAFSFIKKEIDFNNERWTETVEKRREAGRAGAESRWQNMANDSKNSKCHKSHDENGKNSKATSEMAKMADNVYVNDNDSKEILTDVSTKKGDDEASPTSAHYRNFMQWMKDNAPNVYAGCGKNLTETEYTKIREATSKEKLVDCVLAIENRKDLLKKYRSLYLTLRNWIKRDEK